MYLFAFMHQNESNNFHEAKMLKCYILCQAQIHIIFNKSKPTWAQVKKRVQCGTISSNCLRFCLFLLGWSLIDQPPTRKQAPILLSCQKKSYWCHFFVADGNKAVASSVTQLLRTCVKLSFKTGNWRQEEVALKWHQYNKVNQQRSYYTNKGEITWICTSNNWQTYAKVCLIFCFRGWGVM